MNSFKLFSVGGIGVKVHVTFPLILIWSAVQYGFLGQGSFSLSGASFGFVITILLFLCVLVHELSHTLVSKRLGCLASNVILLPTGGISQIREMPAVPAKELVMAIAGPLSNVVIVVILVAIGLFTPASTMAGLRRLALNPMSLGWRDILPYLIVTNAALFGFNLLPVLPMDGGRVMRSLLAIVMTWTRATRITVRVSQGFSGLLALAGLLMGNLLWILIAMSLYSGAVEEGRIAQFSGTLEGMKVEQVLSHDFDCVAPDDPVSHAVDLTMESFQVDFPVRDEGGIVGLLTHKAIIRALKLRQPETPVRDLMTTDIPTAQPNDELFEAYQRMRSSGFHTLPVIEAGELAGLLMDVDDFVSIKEILQDKLQGI